MAFDWVYLFLLGSLMFYTFLLADEKTLADVIFGPAQYSVPWRTERSLPTEITCGRSPIIQFGSGTFGSISAKIGTST